MQGDRVKRYMAPLHIVASETSLRYFVSKT